MLNNAFWINFNDLEILKISVFVEVAIFKIIEEVDIIAADFLGFSLKCNRVHAIRNKAY